MPTTLSIAVGQDGLRIRSADGRTWTDAQLGREGESYRAVAFGGGRCVAVGSYGGDNILAATTDGKAWTTGKQEAKYVQYFRGLTFGEGRFVALGGDPGSVGSSKPFVMFSKDGLSWDGPHAVPGKHILRRAAWGGGRFVAVGDRGRRSASKDGKTWEDAPEAKAIDTLVDVAFGNDVFVGVGLHGLRMASREGLTWTHRQTGPEGEHLNSVVFAGGKFVAVGAGATYTSPDGETWQRTANADAPQVAAHAGGAFVGSAWKGRLLASADGVTWAETHKAASHVLAVAAGHDLIHLKADTMQVLITAERIRERVDELGAEISADFDGQPITVVGVLTGCLIFLADLIRRLSHPTEVALLQASSYRGTATTPGRLEVHDELLPDLAGRHVLLLDDILDTGQTISKLVQHLTAKGAAGVRTCVLLRKVGRQQIAFEPDYVGFGIPDKFVVGYGLDFNSLYRHLPFIAVLPDTAGEG